MAVGANGDLSAGGDGGGDDGGYGDANSRLFEMHLEMNPRDPEYDAKVYLAVDQVGKCCRREWGDPNRVTGVSVGVRCI